MCGAIRHATPDTEVKWIGERFAHFGAVLARNGGQFSLCIRCQWPHKAKVTIAIMRPSIRERSAAQFDPR